MAAAPSLADTLFSRVELRVSARGLKNVDLLSKSDPFLILFDWDARARHGSEIGRTEAVKNSLNPDWQYRFGVNYFFEKRQTLRFLVMDSDSKDTSVSDHDYLGEAVVDLADIVAAPGQKLEVRLRNEKKGELINKGRSILTISCEEVAKANQQARLTLKCFNLDKKDLFGSSDPYVVVYRRTSSDANSEWLEVHRTNVIQNNINPTYPVVNYSLSHFCGGDLYRPLLFKVFDWDRNTDHDMIGEAETNMEELINHRRLVLIHPEKKAKKGASYMAAGSGQLEVQVELFQKYTFLDYIKGGMSISLMVAVDFTGSNGAPSDPASLHNFADPNRPNPYVQVLQTVGSIVGSYDTDQKIPAWGFGAKLPNGEVSHCFNLTLNDNAHVHGIQGVLQAYQAALQRVSLNGPTLFSGLINTARDIAAKPLPANTQNYNILLIITDGVINDMTQTANAIASAANLPLSVIIVGVGDADFTNMNALDGDVRSANSPRDIVNFVPFNKFVAQGLHALGAAALAEVPKQVLAWTAAQGMAPLNASLRPTIVLNDDDAEHKQQ